MVYLPRSRWQRTWRRSLALLLAVILLIACQLQPPAVTITQALPTGAATPTPPSVATEIPGLQAGQPTATALIEMVLPTATQTSRLISTLSVEEIGGTANVSAVPTTPGGRGGTLGVDNVVFVGAERVGDEGQALITLSVEFYGGIGPYTVLNDNRFVISGPPMGSFERGGRTLVWLHFRLNATCDATLVHTIGVVSADGQRVNREYYIDKAPCN